MKTTKKNYFFRGQFIDDNGECHEIDAKKEIIDEYYSIRKLNTRICYMDLIEAQGRICNSSKDIFLFGALFRKLNKKNRLEINISKFCKEADYSRTKVTLMLKKAVECKFLIKEGRGVYFVNPFIIRGLGCKNNKEFEKIQDEWEQIEESITQNEPRHDTLQ